MHGLKITYFFAPLGDHGTVWWLMNHENLQDYGPQNKNRKKNSGVGRGCRVIKNYSDAKALLLENL